MSFTRSNQKSPGHWAAHRAVTDWRDLQLWADDAGRWIGRDKGHRQLSGIDMEERFSEPEPNVIESTEGFSVKVLGRTGMRYTEGTRSVWIDSEVLAKPRAIAMSKKTIRFWEEPEPEEVSEKDRDRIANNIKRAFEACGYELQVHEPFDWTSVALRPPEERHR